MKIFLTPLKVQRYQLNQYFNKNVKENSGKLIQCWRNQFEFIVGTRIRRGQQVVCHYIKIWEKHAFLNFLMKFHSNLIKNRKSFIFSAISLLTFDWERERIKIESVQDYFDEFDKIQGLQEKTIFCNKCNRRKLINNKVTGIDYCDKKCNDNNEHKNADGWEPYLEKENMITWRREEGDGHYAYKVYVHYSDITAEDFLLVQTDVEYRKKWDNSAVKLDIIESDSTKGSNSQIIYWEMLWPKLFANRDYVYNRRCFVDRNRRIILIVNKSTKHPKCPQRPDNHRVEEYWSYMVIKPTTTFKQPGLQFILTYFDNPGVRIPKSITSWVAQRQMPDFLDKLHDATVSYAASKKSVGKVSTPKYRRAYDPGYEYPANFNLTQFEMEDIEEDEEEDDFETLMNTHANEIIKTDLLEDVKESEVDVEESTNKSSGRSWWMWFHPYYYFY